MDVKGSDTASADVMLGRSVDNLFDANDTALPHTGTKIAASFSFDSLVTGLSTLSSSPLVPVRDAVSLLTRPQSFIDKAKIDAWQVSCDAAHKRQTDIKKTAVRNTLHDETVKLD